MSAIFHHIFLLIPILFESSIVENIFWRWNSLEWIFTMRQPWKFILFTWKYFIIDDFIHNAKNFLPPHSTRHKSILVAAILNQPLKLLHRFYCGMEKIAKLIYCEYGNTRILHFSFVQPNSISNSHTFNLTSIKFEVK